MDPSSQNLGICALEVLITRFEAGFIHGVSDSIGLPMHEHAQTQIKSRDIN